MSKTECKFTPLGFETEDVCDLDARAYACKFTPLGFETGGSYAHNEAEFKV